MLTANSTTAERLRGCIFAENFDSLPKITRNGGELNGTKIEYDEVTGAKTVIAKLKKVATASQTVKLNAGTTITITAGNIFGSYSNATAFDLDDFEVDDYREFEFVKVFNTELDSQELSDFEAGSTYNYWQEAWTYLPFNRWSDDLPNKISRDVSGNGNNAQFGDGSTPATYPTKCCGKGYMFNSGEYFKLPNNSQEITHASVIACVEVSDNSSIHCISEMGSYENFSMDINSGTPRMYFSSRSPSSPETFKEGQIITFGGNYDASNTKRALFLNGERKAEDNINCTAIANSNQVHHVGNQASIGSRHYDKNLYSFAFWKNKTLTQLQMLDAHITLMNEVNQL